jgi:hypothetical protein
MKMKKKKENENEKQISINYLQPRHQGYRAPKRTVPVASTEVDYSRTFMFQCYFVNDATVKDTYYCSRKILHMKIQKNRKSY